MATPIIKSLSEIHPSMDLDDLFLYFVKRFEALPQPRSVAEAGITPDELRALILWFSALWGRPRMWCEDTFQTFSRIKSMRRDRRCLAPFYSSSLQNCAGQTPMRMRFGQ